MKAEESIHNNLVVQLFSSVCSIVLIFLYSILKICCQFLSVLTESSIFSTSKVLVFLFQAHRKTRPRGGKCIVCFLRMLLYCDKSIILTKVWFLISFVWLHILLCHINITEDYLPQCREFFFLKKLDFFRNSLSQLVWKLLYLCNLSILFMNSGSVALSWDASSNTRLEPGARVIDDH